MTIQEKGKKIVELVGGMKNIRGLTHCITRLRFNLNDDGKAKLGEIKQLPGILGAQVQGGQTQVIVGGEVNKVYKEILNMYPEIGGASGAGGAEGKQEKKGLGTRMLDALSSILVSSLHPIVGGGMLKGFNFLLTQTKILDAASGTYLILNLISDCMFYFFPFLLALSSAKRFKTNEYMAVSLAGALMYPAFMAAENPLLFMGFIPITVVNYSSSVLPIIFGVLIMSYINRFFEDHIPSLVNIIFAPLLTLLVTIPVVLGGVAPLGYYIGLYVAQFLDWLINLAPWLAGFVVSATRPFLVLAGMHHAIRPLSLQQISTYGYSTIGAMNFMSTMAQASAVFAIYFVAKSKRMKSISLSATISGYLGITEPALYGVIFKYRAAMIGTFLGAGIGGMVGTMFGARSFASAMPSILSLPVYLGPGSVPGLVLGFGATVASTLVITIFLSKSFFKLEDEEEDGAETAGGDPAGATAAVAVTAGAPGQVYAIGSHANGTAFPMKDVSDETFASGIIGPGVAINSSDGKVFAPADCNVVTIFKTKHALGLQMEGGVELMIHIGINTVNLEGRHFTAHCQEGTRVKQGDLLVSFDQEAIAQEGFDTCVLMLVVNGGEFSAVVPNVTQGKVSAGDKVITVTV